MWLYFIELLCYLQTGQVGKWMILLELIPGQEIKYLYSIVATETLTLNCSFPVCIITFSVWKLSQDLRKYILVMC